MKRNLLKIDENEKLRILEMHYKASGKEFISEQSVQFSMGQQPPQTTQTTTPVTKTTDGGVETTLSNENTEDGMLAKNYVYIDNNIDKEMGESIAYSVQGTSYSWESLFKRWNNAIKNKGLTETNKGFYSQLVNRHGTDIFLLFVKNLTTDGSVNSGKIFFKNLTQQQRIKVLDDFFVYYKGLISNKSMARKLQNDKSDLKVVLTKQKSTTVNTETTETKFNYSAPTIDIDDSLVNVLFQNNSSEITPDMMNEINSAFLFIKDFVDESKTNGMTVSCTNLEIDATSSRVRNTNGLTWEKLSTDRANKIKDEYIKRLNGLGVSSSMSPKITIGERGDGTSGPNPPKPYQISSDGNLVSTDQSDTERNKLGTPHANINDYEVYKTCMVKCDFVAELGGSVSVDNKVIPSKTTIPGGYQLYIGNVETDKLNALESKLLEIKSKMDNRSNESKSCSSNKNKKKKIDPSCRNLKSHNIN